MIQRFSKVVTAICVVLAVQTASVFAQNWAFPAKTPNTPVTCTTCPGVPAGSKTVGYSAPIATFVGRFLDSQATRDFQGYYRTARAWNVVPSPDGSRLFMRIGSGIMAYDTSAFITRLAGGERMVGAGAIPTDPTNSGQAVGKSVDEQLLQWDSWFYAEYTHSSCSAGSPGTDCWQLITVDGQDRLYAHDVDDRGNVYLAYEVFGWGIVKDPGGRSGDLMRTLYSQVPEFQPRAIAVARSSAGKYYAFIGDAAGSATRVFDVTDPSHPIPKPTISTTLASAAKTASMDRIAIVDLGGRLLIYDAATVGEGSNNPLATFTAGPHGKFLNVASDGTNFWAVTPGGTAGKSDLIKISPSGNTYSLSTPYLIKTVTPNRMRFNDGYLAIAGFGPWDFRVISIAANGNKVSEVELGSYFSDYYFGAPAGYVSPKYPMNATDAMVVKRGSKDYLLVFARGLGDVYEIKGADSITANVQGRGGHNNSNVPVSAGTTAVYGDSVTFLATGTGSTSSIPIIWNFGNPEAVVEPNTTTGTTGTVATHQYSGSSTVNGTATRTITATSASDSSVVGTATLQLKAPVARIGVNTLSTLVTQPTALAAIPIVAGDQFIDASDGTIESHFNTWAVDAVVTKALPSPDKVPVGACAASHTLTFDAHYGPYSGSGTTLTSLNGPDYAVGIHGATYSVRPFAAAITVASDATNLTFNSASRFADATKLPAADFAALKYKWDLLDATDNVIVAGPTANVATGIQPFIVAKTAFAGTGLRVRLSLSSPAPLTGACAGLNLETSNAFTARINAPDPVISGDCTAGGPPCNFSVASAGTTDVVADGWTYLWSVTPSANVTATTTTAKTFSPTFTATGAFTIKVTVTNAVGFSVSKERIINVTKAGTNCTQMTDTSTFIEYGGKNSFCNANSPTCSNTEDITFTVSTWQGSYDFACSAHTYLWTFPDGTTATTRTVSNKKISRIGNGNVTVVLNNGSQSKTLSATLNISGPITPPTPQTPNPTSCSVMNDGNVFISFSAPSGCSYVNTSACKTSEAVAFSALSFGYSFTCANHIFFWNFGDGQSASGQNVSHTYATGSTYTATLTVQNNAQTFATSLPVVVSGTSAACLTPSASNIVVGYNAPSGCSHTNSAASCTSSENVAFSAIGNGYNFSCGAHTYSWNFGDNSTSTSAAPSHRYTTPGTYPVTLTVSNPAGQSATISSSVKVSAGPTGPCGEMTTGKLFITFANAAGSCSQALTNATCATNELLSFNVDVFNYNINCAPHNVTWEFGDGQTASGRATTHKFTGESNYPVKATVNNGSSSIVLSETVKVKGQGGSVTVKVDFTVTPVAGIANAWRFTPIVDVEGIVTKWVWDYGDNSTETVTSSTASPRTHIYESGGKHVVTLRAENAGGLVAQAEHTIGGTTRSRRASH